MADCIELVCSFSLSLRGLFNQKKKDEAKQLTQTVTIHQKPENYE